MGIMVRKKRLFEDGQPNGNQQQAQQTQTESAAAAATESTPADRKQQRGRRSAEALKDSKFLCGKTQRARYLQQSKFLVKIHTSTRTDKKEDGSRNGKKAKKMQRASAETHENMQH